MCELLGLSPNVAGDVCSSFAGLMRRGGQTGPHADGWGVAFYEHMSRHAALDPRRGVEGDGARHRRDVPQGRPGAAAAAPIASQRAEAQGSRRPRPMGDDTRMSDAAEDAATDGALAGRRVMVPETRELEVLARMLERHGATALRCPLVAIIDAPDPAPVEAWLRRFIAAPPDDLILLTGEGLSRLHAAAQRAGIEAGFLAALRIPRRVVRGPKPQARLRALGLAADLSAAEPTTAGVIATLAAQPMQGRRVGVQLYPDNPNRALLEFLAGAGATADAVLPYAYASQEDDARVLAMLAEMEAGRIDLAVFTSTPQVKRLAGLAPPERLRAALARTRIAAVGPVVGQALEAAGATVAVMPAESFHMKPMVNAIIAALGRV